MNVDIELYNIELDSTYESVSDKADFLKKQEKYLAFKDIFELTEYLENNTYQNLLRTRGSFVVCKDDLIALTIANVKFSVTAQRTQVVNVSKQLANLAQKPIELLRVPGGDTFNNKCEVHMPGQALSMYNDIMLMEDACADELQASINIGWRIIATCPQPTQRRPDYILGRYNPERKPQGGAVR